MKGDWNLPLATTTRSKVSVMPECSTSQPAFASAEIVDPGAEPDARRQRERLGIAMQVGENVAVRREHQIALVLQVAEGREDPTGVGVHGRPDPADAVQPGPLPAQHRGSARRSSARSPATAASAPQPARRGPPRSRQCLYGFLSSPELSHTASITLNDVPETSYASCGDLSLAYQVFGDGPVELVWAGSFASHVELFWSMPEFGALMEKLGAFCSRPVVRQGRGRAVGPGSKDSHAR